MDPATYIPKSSATKPEGGTRLPNHSAVGGQAFGTSVIPLPPHARSESALGSCDNKAKEACLNLPGCDEIFAQGIARVVAAEVKPNLMQNKDGSWTLRLCTQEDQADLQSRTETMLASCHALGMTRTAFLEEPTKTKGLPKLLWTNQIRFTRAEVLSIEIDRCAPWTLFYDCFFALLDNHMILPAYLLGERTQAHLHYAYPRLLGSLSETFTGKTKEDYQSLSELLIARALESSTHHDPLAATEILMREMVKGMTPNPSYAEPSKRIQELVAKHFRPFSRDYRIDLLSKYGKCQAVVNWVYSQVVRLDG